MVKVVTIAEILEGLAERIEQRRLQTCTAGEPADCINWQCVGYIESVRFIMDELMGIQAGEENYHEKFNV